jgi:nicotinamidase-related amidase
VHKDGKLSGKGYASFAEEHNSFEHINNAITSVDETLFVKLAFKEDYSNVLPESPLFGKAKEFNALQENTWATEYVESIKVRGTIFVKDRISAFSNKSLVNTLQGKKDLYIVGVATDLAVLATAFDAHDAGFNVYIVADACIAANQKDHDSAITILEKFCKIVHSKEI